MSAVSDLKGVDAEQGGKQGGGNPEGDFSDPGVLESYATMIQTTANLHSICVRFTRKQTHRRITNKYRIVLDVNPGSNSSIRSFMNYLRVCIQDAFTTT